MEKVMNKAGEIDHSSGSPVSGGTFSITTLESVFVKVDDDGIFTAPLIFTFTGGTHSAGTPNSAVGGGVISSGATKVKVDNALVILEGDTGTLIGTYVDPSSGSPVSFSSDVEVSDAGQTAVEAE